MNDTPLEKETLVLQYYASIAEASGRMLTAAQEGNWDLLCAAEEQCSRLIDRLQLVKDDQFMTEEERAKRMGFLKKILADDAAIRHITTPRLKQLEDLIRSSRNENKLRGSYGSSAP